MDPHPAKPPVRHQWHRTAGPGKSGSIPLHLSPLPGSATEILSIVTSSFKCPRGEIHDDWRALIENLRPELKFSQRSPELRLIRCVLSPHERRPRRQASTRMSSSCRLSTLVFLAVLNCRLRLSYSRLPRVSYWRFPDSGGNSLNIFATPLSRFFSFFAALSESVPSALPRQISCFDFASNMSTTSVPSL